MGSRNNYFMRFFPLKFMERKVQEFINLKERGLEYEGFFYYIHQTINVCSNPSGRMKARMNMFVMGVFDFIKNECLFVILLHSIDISSLMVHPDKIVEQQLKKQSLPAKQLPSCFFPQLGKVG